MRAYQSLLVLDNSLLNRYIKDVTISRAPRFNANGAVIHLKGKPEHSYPLLLSYYPSY